MGLNVDRDALCLVQISTGKKDAHIVQLNRELYNSPNLKILTDKNISKFFVCESRFIVHKKISENRC